MATQDCLTTEFLLQADLDGELDVSGTASLAAHLVHCDACQTQQARLARVSARLRTELPYYAAPTELRERIAAMAAATGAASNPARRPEALRVSRWHQWSMRVAQWMRAGLPVGAGAALAASALLVMLPRGIDFTDSMVASHIRALQPSHLMDVVSTDQHTVKPWFDGKLDFAPPVKDLKADGFPLIGGRLDYVAGRSVAAMAYGRDKHFIDVYAWPSSSRIDAAPNGGERNGYNYVRWTQDDMVLWAISDLNKTELNTFVERWRDAR